MEILWEKCTCYLAKTAIIREKVWIEMLLINLEDESAR